MPYRMSAPHPNRVLITLLLDQSYSMVDPIARSSTRKMDELATAVNHWLHDLCDGGTGNTFAHAIQNGLDWPRTEDEVLYRNPVSGYLFYVDIAVVGYGTDDEGNPIIESAFGRPDQPWLSVEEIAQNPLGLERHVRHFQEHDGEMREQRVRMPIWVEPKAHGGTPTCTALYRTYEIVERWIQQNGRWGGPPVVLHFTDGENIEDGDPREYAESITNLQADDGNVLLFNCFIADAHTKEVVLPTCEFPTPSEADLLPNQYARDLFTMSSEFPELFIESANKDCELTVQPGARGLMLNADTASLTRFIHIGTLVATHRARECGRWLEDL